MDQDFKLGHNRLLLGDQHSDLGVLPLHDSSKLVDMATPRVARLDGEDDLHGPVARPIVEVKPSVDALVRALLLFLRPRTHTVSG